MEERLNLYILKHMLKGSIIINPRLQRAKLKEVTPGLDNLSRRALSDRLLPTTDAGIQATFSCIFQSISWLYPFYEQQIVIHDKRSLCFLSLTDLSTHKQRKTQASWFSATNSYGEKSLPALQLYFTCHQNNVFVNNLFSCYRGVWGRYSCYIDFECGRGTSRLRT